MRSLLATGAAILSISGASSGQSTTVISNGSEADISRNGDCVAFVESGRLRVWTRATQLVEELPIGMNGAVPNGPCSHPSVSEDGRYVAFDSTASNLVTNDTNGAADVFLHDRANGQTTRLSVTSLGEQRRGWAPSISDDGMLIAFESTAGNLVTPPAVGTQNIFLHNRGNGSTILVSPMSAWTGANGSCTAPQIAGGGGFVAFTVEPQSTFRFVARYDVATGEADVAVGPAIFPWGPRHYQFPSISADGRFVACAAFDNTTSGMTLAVAVDLAGPSYATASITPNGTMAYGHVGATAISDDGNRVAFSSGSTAFNGPANAAYVWDRSTGSAKLASIEPNGNPTTSSMDQLSLSGSGRFVLFRAPNGNGSLYLRDTLACPSLTAYCTSSTTTNGCTPVLTGSGIASASVPTGFTLSASNIEGQRTGLIFYGLWPTAQSWGLGSSSYLCVIYPAQRLGSQHSGGTSATCTGAFSTDWNAWRAANPIGLGHPFLPGDTFYAQAWFRDGAAVKGTNLTNGLRFTLCD